MIVTREAIGGSCEEGGSFSFKVKPVVIYKLNWCGLVVDSAVVPSCGIGGEGCPIGCAFDVLGKVVCGPSDNPSAVVAISPKLYDEGSHDVSRGSKGSGLRRSLDSVGTLVLCYALAGALCTTCATREKSRGTVGQWDVCGHLL